MVPTPTGPPWSGVRSAPKANSTALFALLVGISGFVCFWGAGGALALALGLIARSEIERADGRETGRALATTAIVLGVLNMAATLVALAVGMTYLARTGASPSTPIAGAPTLPMPIPSSPPAPRASPLAERSPAASRENVGHITRFGTITLADPPTSGSLGAELGRQRASARSASETLVLWLVAPNCKPCDGVAFALRDPLMQRELAHVRLIRIDASEFAGELGQFGIPTEKIPGFVLLDGRNHPRDFIHGGEWDADIAANMAPVLGKFVRGEFRLRRHRWHDSEHDDVTPT